MAALYLGCALILCSALLVPSLCAQPASFGSADDPTEQMQTAWWQRENSLDVLGGLSLIGPQWQAATSLQTNVATRSLTAHLDATLRAGYYSTYGPDFDETYDALRVIDYVRYAPPGRSLYLRAGPVKRMRLGTGQVVNFFNSSVAWDERSVGGETLLQSRYGSLAFFTDNLLMDGVTAGRLALQPLRGLSPPRLRSLRLGVGVVSDLSTWSEPTVPPLAAYSVDAQLIALRAGSIHLSPFASFATYTRYGSGVGLGLDLESANFIDLARFRLRLGVHYSGDQFIPGYVGSFYPVSNTQARIVSSEAFRTTQIAEQRAGVPLSEARGGNDVVTELRLLIFETFEFWYYFRRHHGSQALSEYHLRLAVRGGNRFRLEVGQDRGGLTSFFSLFDALGDQTALVFNAAYRVRGGFWVHIRSRYTYERLRDNPERYLVERRFEPLAGFRLTF